MAIRVEEKSVNEIRARLEKMQTDLNQIVYLESAIKRELAYDVKRFIFSKLSDLYETRRMYDKAAKALQNKASVDITFKEKIESYLRSGELYAKSGRLEEAEEMFLKSYREANTTERQRTKLAMKNIFLVQAQIQEKQGRRASAVRYYEKLIKMSLDQLEKNEIKEKLISIYKALGRFHDAKLIEGL